MFFADCPARAEFSAVEIFEVDKSTTLGVWGNRTRFLLPGAENAPSSGMDWRGVFDHIVIKPGASWGDALARDTNRVRV